MDEKELQREIVRLRKDGKSFRNIAMQINTSCEKCYRVYKKLPAKEQIAIKAKVKPGRTFTDEIVKDMIQLLIHKDMSFDEIGKYYNTSGQCVKFYIKRYEKEKNVRIIK